LLCLRFHFSLSERGEEMLKWRDYFSAHIRPGVHIELKSNLLRKRWKYLSEEAINLVEKISNLQLIQFPPFSPLISFYWL
jgi:hypothetical protein